MALAHELAGFGTLTSQQLAGEAARRRLQALGFALTTTNSVAPGPVPNSNADSLVRLQRHHVEEAVAEIRESMEFAIAQKHIAKRPHETEWRVHIDGLWYSPRMLRFYAYSAAGLSLDNDLSKSEYDRFRAHLEALGFPVKRGRTPVRARAAGDLRRAAAALIGLADNAASSESAEDDADPLQILMDGTVYPAGVLLGLMRDTTLSDQDFAAIADADAVLRAAPDPLDLECRTQRPIDRGSARDHRPHRAGKLSLCADAPARGVLGDRHLDARGAAGGPHSSLGGLRGNASRAPGPR